MSEKLEKIGGYVVNGQPQLAHDNTLKGTGLPDSPLGTDETVLWEGDETDGATITLSETLNNFEYVKIVYIDVAGWGSGVHIQPVYTPTENRYNITGLYSFTTTSNYYNRLVSIQSTSINSLNFTVSTYDSVGKGITYFAHLTKVIGFNRK